MALSEGIALFHQDRELAIGVMERWYGFTRERAEIFYARGQWIPKKPYPCREGLRRTAEVYDSLAMRNARLEDYYDASIVAELDDEGFLDGLYE